MTKKVGIIWFILQTNTNQHSNSKLCIFKKAQFITIHLWLSHMRLKSKLWSFWFALLFLLRLSFLGLEFLRCQHGPGKKLTLLIFHKTFSLDFVRKKTLSWRANSIGAIVRKDWRRFEKKLISGHNPIKQILSLKRLN